MTCQVLLWITLLFARFCDNTPHTARYRGAYVAFAVLVGTEDTPNQFSRFFAYYGAQYRSMGYVSTYCYGIGVKISTHKTQTPLACAWGVVYARDIDTSSDRRMYHYDSVGCRTCQYPGTFFVVLGVGCYVWDHIKNQGVRAREKPSTIPSDSIDTNQLAHTQFCVLW